MRSPRRAALLMVLLVLLALLGAEGAAHASVSRTIGAGGSGTLVVRSAQPGTVTLTARARCPARLVVAVDRGRRRSYALPAGRHRDIGLGAVAKGSHRVSVSASGRPGCAVRVAIRHRAVMPVAGNPLAALPLYVDPGTQAAEAARRLRDRGRAGDADVLGRIASQPQARWLTGGETTSDVVQAQRDAAAAGGLPVYVLYDIPGRDCGSYSSGGAGDAAGYRRWVDGIAAGLGTHPAAVIVEPDALAALDCRSATGRATTVDLLRHAVRALAARPGVTVYLDAGNAPWHGAATIAQRLRAAGVAEARGFSLNVSNFRTTGESIAYGTAIAEQLGTPAHFVIDTSRNGAGPAAGDEWCNPPGRAVGTAPTTATASPLVDAYLWIKLPGESDGTCNGGPPAGEFWVEQALDLARSAHRR